jgi:hypothetical protein
MVMLPTRVRVDLLSPLFVMRYVVWVEQSARLRDMVISVYGVGVVGQSAALPEMFRLRRAVRSGDRRRGVR